MVCAWQSVELERDYPYDLHKYQARWEAKDPLPLKIKPEDYYMPMSSVEDPIDLVLVATHRFNGADDPYDQPVYKNPKNIPLVKKFISAGIVTFGMMYMDPVNGPFTYAKEGFIADVPCNNM